MIASEFLIAGPAAVAAAAYMLKRIFAFDLELRANRERLRADRECDRARALSARAACAAKLSSAADVDYWSPQDVSQNASETLALLQRMIDDISPHVADPDTLIEGLVRTVPDSHLRRLWITDGAIASDVMLLVRAGAALARMLAHYPAQPSDTRVSVEVPIWILALLAPTDADRCAREWAAHLHERIADGELDEARADRRGFVRHAIGLAIRRRVAHAARSRS